MKAPGPQYPTGVAYHTGNNYSVAAHLAATRNRAKLNERQQFVIDKAVAAGADGVTSIDFEAMTGRGTNWFGPRLTELKRGGLMYTNGTLRTRVINGELRGPAEIHWIKPDGEFDKAKAKPSKMSRVDKLKAAIADLQAENYHLKQRLAARTQGQGELF